MLDIDVLDVLDSVTFVCACKFVFDVKKAVDLPFHGVCGSNEDYPLVVENDGEEACSVVDDDGEEFIAVNDDDVVGEDNSLNDEVIDK